MSKINNSNNNNKIPKEKNMSNTAKSLSSQKKKSIDKVAVGIVVLAVILVGLIGTQLVLNGPSTSSDTKYSYFNELDTTFSASFLTKLNAYRNTNGLSELNRVPSVTNGSSSTFTLPDLSTVARENKCNTEDKLAEVVLQKFIASSENKQIATASVSNIYLNTTVTNNTLTLVVKVPFEQ
ncbi:hypothetical protein [uncultured Clostridium sp.]|uniref:hypothetical protein n=1 Tax=uncultured Clostridium sp. TaxID=59620 RepID=UPI00263057DA|nr:hypothetical protein [uncultured Clostridium sp.]